MTGGTAEAAAKSARRGTGDSPVADWIAAAGIALITLAAYLLTAYPGLGGGGDAAKFRFIGRVLGTAHPPGYPLYVLVSHLFSLLPIGTLAWRINVMSAVCATLAAVATYVTIRALGGRPLAGAATSLALAFGRIFWLEAGIAEVYSLAACLAAASLAALVTWGNSRRAGHLLLAVAFVSAAFGNHLTVMFAVPAFVLYVLWTDWRSALRPRIVLAATIIILVGVSQYGFVILRTLQNAPYLESRATTLRELWAVMTARQYSADILPFTLHQWFTERIPMLASLIARELGWLGVALLPLGAWALVRSRTREFVLLAVGGLGVLTIVSVVAADAEGFITPAFVFLWPIAGVGLETAGRLFERRGGGRLATAAFLLLATLGPVAQFVANFRANDHSLRDFEDVYFAALFRVLPDKTLIPAEAYATDQLVLYELLGANAAGSRDIRHVALQPDAIVEAAGRGHQVYAFDAGRQVLERFGLRFEPVQLFGRPLPAFLDTVRPAWTVAIAATPGSLRALGKQDFEKLCDLGNDTCSPAGGEAFALVGVPGAKRRGFQRSGPSVELTLPGQPGASTSPFPKVAVTATASASGARILIGEREVAAAPSGIALAILTPDGRLVQSAVVQPSAGYRVPIDMTLLPVYRMTFAGRCQNIGNLGWTDVGPASQSGAAVVRVDNYRPFQSVVELWMESNGGSPPRLLETGGTGTPAIDIQSFDLARAADAEAVGRLLAQGEGPKDLLAAARARHLQRLRIRVNDNGDFFTATVDLGGAPGRAAARATVDLNNPRRATVCSAPPAN